mgnify:CR=1 FL=1
MTHADLSRRPRSHRVFSDDDMARMQALYYDPAVPLTKVAGAFGVPVSTFLRWIAEMDWPRRRERLPVVAAPLPEQSPPAPVGRKRRAPRLGDALRDIEALARRELGALSGEQPRSLSERERIARLVESLTRSLDRIVAAREAESRKDLWRKTRPR